MKRCETVRFCFPKTTSQQCDVLENNKTGLYLDISNLLSPDHFSGK